MSSGVDLSHGEIERLFFVQTKKLSVGGRK